MPPCSDPSETFHATTLSVEDKGVLILGPSGSGKSALGLELMAYGAVLVADDRTIVARVGDRLCASAPPAIKGMIEARGVGILNVPQVDHVDLAVVIDLNKIAQERLPDARLHTLLGVTLPLLCKVPAPHFAAAVLAYVRSIKGNPNARDI